MTYQQKNQTKPELREIDTTTWQRLPCMIRRRTDMSSNDKLVYMYMLSQFVHFKKLGMTYHENMQDIADEIGIGRKTVGDCINRLEKLRLLAIHKKSVYNSERSVISYSYTINDEYSVFVDKPKLKASSDDEGPF